MNNQIGSSNQASRAMINQVSEHQVPELAMDQTKRSVGSFMQTLSPVQYQHLMNVLNIHLKAAKMDIKVDTNSSNMSGTCFSISNISSQNSFRHCVVDSGATNHICSNRLAFYALKYVENALPYHEKDSCAIYWC